MKDFKNPNLYKLEQGTFETFVDEMLETNTEYNQTGRMRSGLNEEEEEETDYFGSIDDWGSTDAMDDFGFDFSTGLDNYSSDTTDKLVNPRGYTVDEMGTLKMLTSAPLYAVQQAGDALVNTRKLNDKTKKLIAKDWRVWGLFLGVFSLLGLFRFITSFIYLPVGILMIVSAGLADYYYGQHGGHSILSQLINGDEEDFEEDSGETSLDDGELGSGLGSEFGSEEGTGGFGGFGGDSGFGGFGGFGDDSGFGDDDSSLSDRYADHVDEDAEDESESEEYYDPESMGALATDFFPESPIDTSTTETFREGLLDVYKSGLTTKGKMISDRKEMVKYYAQYMPNNDKAFARWTTLREHSPEYDNIAYTIYKALISIDGKFDMRNAVPNGDKLVVMEMKRTPLIYKITVKLPSYFKINSITTRSNIFNDMLKASDDDEKVGTILTTYGGDLVIKFLRLDYKKLVSMGDLLRLTNDDSSESFAEQFATDKGIPMVAGMRDNEYPYMVDIVGNPAASIVGGSGSGKSWLTFQFMDSMLIANNPEHMNFLILDAKDAAIWKQFALAPHVIGYHSDYTDFYDILLEVKAEHERRMAELSRLGIESWKDYTSRAKRNGEDEKLADMPLLFVIIDEITYTMSSLQNEDDALYKELKNMLTQLSSVIRASGIRMMLIGQRAIDTSIPKGFMANSPLKLAMKMNVQSDFTTMLGKGYDREVSRIPSGPGEGIMLAEGQTKSSYVKTVIPGGKDDGDILMQVRVLALDWVRRTQGTRYDYTTLYNSMRTTISKGFNRDMYYNQALLAIEEGRITDPNDVDEVYLMAVNSPQANLLNNAMENVGRKLDEQQVSVNVTEPQESLESEPEILPEFDWDSLLEEPEHNDEYELEYEEEPELKDEYGFEEEPEFKDEFELEEELESKDEFELEEELESKDEYGFEEEPEFKDEFEFEEEPESKDEYEFEEEVQPEPEMDNGDLSIEDLLAQDDELESNTTDTNNIKPTHANAEDITTMLDIVSETQTQQLHSESTESYTESEEYKQYLQEKQELEELKQKQKEMLDKLQKQREQQRLKEEKQKRELAEQKRLAEEQAKIKAQREELEKQKQEILRLQQELGQQTQPELETQPESNSNAKTNSHMVNQESVAENIPIESKSQATSVPKKKATPTPKPPVVKKEPVVKKKPVSRPKQPKQVTKNIKPDDEIRLTEQPNTVTYEEMENMSVSQYVAKFGETAGGQRRVKSQIINAKFNRRKVSLAIAVGEIYEEGEYFYYVG